MILTLKKQKIRTTLQREEKLMAKIDPETFESIFSNIEEIFNIHGEFLNQLANIVSSWSTKQILGQTLKYYVNPPSPSYLF